MTRSRLVAAIKEGRRREWACGRLHCCRQRDRRRPRRPRRPTRRCRAARYRPQRRSAPRPGVPPRVWDHPGNGVWDRSISALPTPAPCRAASAWRNRSISESESVSESESLSESEMTIRRLHAARHGRRDAGATLTRTRTPAPARDGSDALRRPVNRAAASTTRRRSASCSSPSAAATKSGSAACAPPPLNQPLPARLRPPLLSQRIPAHSANAFPPPSALPLSASGRSRPPTLPIPWSRPNSVPSSF